MATNHQEHLPRLDPSQYRGRAYVHWTMTIEHRHTGWLTSQFHSRFRELLTHTTFRFAIVCPIYCLMPDHMHFVWIGVDERSDQLKATKYFRKHVGVELRKQRFSFQHQSHDRVLRSDERCEDELGDLIEYIARNPERRGLVEPNGFRSYPYCDCLIPGYPELCPWQDDYWPRFWRTYSFLCKHGLFRKCDEEFK